MKQRLSTRVFSGIVVSALIGIGAFGCHDSSSSGSSSSGGGGHFEITSMDPTHGATSVERTSAITVTFNQDVDDASVDSTSVSLVDSQDNPVAGALAVSGATVTFTPDTSLAIRCAYTFTVQSGVRSVSGSALGTETTLSFATRDGLWGAPALAETDNAGDAYNPQIAFDSEGNALAVWQQSDGARFNIWSSRYTPGSGWGAAELIENDNAGGANVPMIAIDASGNAIAVWYQHDGTRYNIYANRYTVDSGWGAAVEIDGSNGDATHPEIAVDPDGNALVVWHQFDGQWNIWSSRYTPGGGWGAAGLIEDGAHMAYRPRIAMDAEGNALAVWRQSDGIRDNIYAKRYTNGSGWGGVELIETDNAGTAGEACISMDADGNAIAVWYQHDGTYYNIWANRYTAGSGWGAAEMIDTEDAGDAIAPRISLDAAGNAIAVWFQDDGTYDNIWANRYTAGSGWGVAELIETENDGDTYYPRLAVDAAGNAIAVWSQYDGTRNNIWANRYTPDDGWGTAELIETQNDGGADSPMIAVNALGEAIAVWHQHDGTRNNICSNLFE